MTNQSLPLIAGHYHSLPLTANHYHSIVLTARVVCREPPLTLASGAQIWATDWFLCKKKDSEAFFVPHLAYFGYLIVISLIT